MINVNFFYHSFVQKPFSYYAVSAFPLCCTCFSLFGLLLWRHKSLLCLTLELFWITPRAIFASPWLVDRRQHPPGQDLRCRNSQLRAVIQSGLTSKADFPLPSAQVWTFQIKSFSKVLNAGEPCDVATCSPTRSERWGLLMKSRRSTQEHNVKAHD